MPFRDDRDAMREKMELLERELSKARGDLGRLQLEHQESSEEAGELRRRLERLQSERASLGSAPRRRRPIVLLVLVPLAVLLGVVFWAERSYRAHQEAARRALAERRLEETRAESEAERRMLEEQLRAATAPTEPPRPQPPEPAPAPEAVPLGPMMELTWAAKVTRVEAAPLRRGARCEIRAAIQPGASIRANVACGETTLYDWNEALGSGMQMRSCSLMPTEGGDAALQCSDTGPRTGRPQLSIDTAAKTATVWKDGGLRVVLAVETVGARESGRVSVSTTVVGGDASGFAAIVRSARVTNVVGDPGVRRGATCAVVVTTGEAPHPCRVAVQCGDRTLYGGGSEGFANCEIVDGKPTTIRDTNPSSHGGDPMLDVDLPADRAVVSEQAPDWSVTMALSR